MIGNSPEPPGSNQPVHLIVNADDFGYGFAVSRGITRAIQAGTVTATGVLANATRLAEQLQLLFESAPDVDLGVHLNLTFGRPISRGLDQHLSGNGDFPGWNAMITGVMSRRIPIAAIEKEWRCQIERCLETGMQPRFLNSHEHVHMLPPLYALSYRLAEAYGIRQVRRVTADRLTVTPLAALFRVGLMTVLASFNRKTPPGPSPRLLGLAKSGKLDTGYYRRLFPTLKKGSYYELMCHPGYLDPREISDPRILRYHAWETELNSLLDPSFRELCSQYDIRLVGYRHLEQAGVRSREEAA